jgi:hypothetical protein
MQRDCFSLLRIEFELILARPVLHSAGQVLKFHVVAGGEYQVVGVEEMIYLVTDSR